MTLRTLFTQWGMLLLVGHVVAWFTTNTLAGYVAVFALTTIALWGLVAVVTQRVQRATAESLRPVQEWIDEVHRLSIPEARERAEALLADASRFECTLGAPDANLDMLGKELQDFFRRYRRVQGKVVPLELDRDTIAASPSDPRFLKIGVTVDHAEVVVRPGRDEIYEIDGPSDDEALSESYPSVYHWLVTLGGT